MSEENLPPPPSNPDSSDQETSGGASGVDRGSQYNQAPTGPTIFQIGNIITTKDDATKASNAIDLAIMKKIEELIKKGKIEEALLLAEKVKNISLKQKIEFALQKGIIKTPGVQPGQKIKKINENGPTQMDY
ncbi:MAG: hypothetical protein Fur0024_2530 [Patescibacteria group bacterium]